MINNSFAKQTKDILSFISDSIAKNETIDMYYFIEITDNFTWVALSKGDIIPKLYIDMIDKALGYTHSKENEAYSGRYKDIYKAAVNTYNKEIDKKVRYKIIKRRDLEINKKGATELELKLGVGRVHLIMSGIRVPF